MLDSGKITEHDGEMFCGSCYGKFFGPKGYGFGGGAGTLSMDDGRGYKVHNIPSSIYSWSISQILEHEFWEAQGSKGGKSGFEFFWATFEGGFQLFVGKKNYNFFENIVASALKSCTE